MDGNALTAHTLRLNGAKDAPLVQDATNRICGPHHRRGHDGAQPAGPGYKEEVYEPALAAELREREYPARRNTYMIHTVQSSSE